MVSAGVLVGYLVIVAVHTLITVVATRFFRLRLKTRWGAALYTVVLTPIILIFSTLLLSGLLGLGGDVGSREAALVIVFLVPLALGYTLDLFWLPDPREVELPEERT